MELALISIIIPVYNVEKYLSQCLDSVIGQTYHKLQILLVDDGSTDLSGSICDEYEQKDPRIQVIHQNNGGLSCARNVGIDHAIGDYIFFLDSDDYLEPEAVRILISEIEATGADISFGNLTYSYQDYETTASFPYSENTILSNVQGMRELVSGKIETFAWGKMIRTDLVKKHQFPQGRLFEDHFWTHYIFHEAQKIAIVPTVTVHYRQRDNSISYAFTLKRLDVLDGWSDRISFLNKEYPELVKDCKRVIADRYAATAWIVLTRMKMDKRKAFKAMRSFSAAQNLAAYADSKSQKLILALDKGILHYAVLALWRKVTKTI